MQDIKQQEEMNKRFDELRKQVAGHYDIALPPEVFTFLQSEISLAVEQEKERIVDMIKDMFLCNYPIYDKNRNIKEIEEDIITLINNK